MKNCENQSLIEELTGLLLKISEGKSDERMRKQANRLIGRISPSDMVHAERRLIENGLTATEVRQVSATFVLMGVLNGNGSDLRHSLPDGHILRLIMAEHEIIRCFVAELEEINAQIQRMDKIGPSCSEVMRLAHVVKHLNAMEEHVDRENDVLFPALKTYGWASLFERIQSDHLYLRMAVDDLLKLTIAAEKMAPAVFKKSLETTVKHLSMMMREHLFNEDRILFPLAVAMIEDETVWNNLKHTCTEIGYCGFHF